MASETSANISNVSNSSDLNDTWREEQFIFDKHKQGAGVIAIFVLAYLAIFLLCVVGNVLVLVVVALNRNMRTVTNFFIANLAAADLLIGVFCLPFNLADNIMTSWPFGAVMCKTSLTVLVLSVSASVFTLIAIAVDRYYAVVFPTSAGVTHRRMRYILGSVWVVAVVTCVPQGLVLTSTTYEGLYTPDGKVVTACEESWPGQHYQTGYVLSLFATSYVLPLSVIAVLYTRICRTLWNRPRPGANHQPTTTQQGGAPHVAYNAQDDTVTIHLPPQQGPADPHLQKKLHVIRMLLVVVVVFALSWLPLHVTNLVTVLADLSDGTVIVLYRYVFPIVHCVALFNCGINPVIYGYYNNNMRKGFYQLVSRTPNQN